MPGNVALLASVVAMVITGIAVVIFLQEAKPPASQADPTVAAQVAAGQVIYSANCASCHGDQLQGEPNWKERKPDGKLPAPPHDATEHTWHDPDQQLFDIIKRGVAAVVPNYPTDMIGFGEELSDQDIWNVLAYIKSRWPGDIQAKQAEMSRAAAQQGVK